SFIVPYPKWADAKLNVLFSRMNAVGKGFNKQINIISPPVGNIAYAIGVSAECLCIRYRLVAAGIGIKIVVEMHAVDIVIPDYIHDNTDDVFADFGNARVK